MEEWERVGTIWKRYSSVIDVFESFQCMFRAVVSAS